MQTQTGSSLTRRSMIAAALRSGFLLACPAVLRGQDDVAVEPQPYFASVGRVIQGLRSLGAPLAPADAERITRLTAVPSPANVQAAETILARYTLMRVRLNPDGTALTAAGDSSRELVEQGWRAFLIRVENPGALAVALTSISQAAVPEGSLSRQMAISREPGLAIGNLDGAADYARRWMGFKFFGSPPLAAALSGLAIEYRIVDIFSRDSGRKSAYLQA